MVAPLTRRRFTVDEYERMAAAGILHEDDRVELIAGEIVQMTPISSRHAAAVARLTALLFRMVPERAILWSQSPVRLDEHLMPQPDVALLKPRDDFYAARHPGPADVQLLVEVADTSLAYDRGVKLPLYAEAGVPEVWLVDVERDAIVVHREPADARYCSVTTLQRGEQIAPAAFDDVSLPVAAILGG